MGLSEFFDDHRFLPHRSGGTQEAWKAPRVFSIEDVLPATKPDVRAFQRVLRQALTFKSTKTPSLPQPPLPPPLLPSPTPSYPLRPR